MKTEKSSNSHEDSRKVYHPEDREAMKETSKLQGKNPGDGREETYKKEGDEMTEAEAASTKKDITGKSNEEDVKKEFEIRSGKSGEDDGKKREKDPMGESEEVHGEEKEDSPGWRRSYKGDAELVP